MTEVTCDCTRSLNLCTRYSDPTNANQLFLLSSNLLITFLESIMYLMTMQRACLLRHATDGTVFLECSVIIRKCNILFSFNFNEMPRPGRRVRRGARQEAARAVSCINKIQNMFPYLWSCCLCSSKHNEFVLVSGEFSVLVIFWTPVAFSLVGVTTSDV